MKKIDKAVEETERLHTFIREYLPRDENKAVLGARYDQRSGKHQIYISETPDLTELRDEISIAVGIIVHLLRSSLDNMVYERALAFTNGDIRYPRRLQFPIVDSEGDYDEEANRWIGELSPEDQAVIKSFQPFHGIAGRPDRYSGPYVHQLSLLREISNDDKHREVVRIGVDPNHFEINEVCVPILNSWTTWTREHPREYFDNARPIEMNIGEMVFEAAVDGLSLNELQVAGHAMANITLDERRSLIPTLQRIATFVRNLVDDVYN